VSDRGQQISFAFRRPTTRRNTGPDERRESDRSRVGGVDERTRREADGHVCSTPSEVVLGIQRSRPAFSRISAARRASTLARRA